MIFAATSFGFKILRIQISAEESTHLRILMSADLNRGAEHAEYPTSKADWANGQAYNEGQQS
jgi:hypothetical protein